MAHRTSALGANSRFLIFKLDQIDLAVGPSEFVALLGPSGCGKSTLLRLIAGLERPCSGRIFISANMINGPDPSRILVFQDPTLYPWRTVRQNVALGLDVGCGTGSLTFALTKFADLGEISAIDYSPAFVEAANRRNTDPRIKIQQADACALRFDDGTFDRALALLVLHFVSEARKAVAEMRRVVRPGGVVAAVVWDHLGGMPGMRMIIDTVAVLTEGGRQLINRYCPQPMMLPGEMKQTFFKQGLADVTETELMIRMDYRDFDDYWAPIAGGEGPLGKYVATLGAAERVHTDAAVRDAYEAGRPDGPRSFANVAGRAGASCADQRATERESFRRLSVETVVSRPNWIRLQPLPRSYDAVASASSARASGGGGGAGSDSCSLALLCRGIGGIADRFAGR